MSTLVLANFPIAFLIFAAIVSIPLWLTFKRPDRAPAYALATSAAGRPAAARTASAARSVNGLSAARQHATADRTPVPGRRHAAPTGAIRRHTQADRDRIRA